MTESDLEACRAAFPALNWRQVLPGHARGRSQTVTVSVVIIAPTRTEAWATIRSRTRLPLQEYRTLDAALGALRQAMTAVRDDLTAALGEP